MPDVRREFAVGIALGLLGVGCASLSLARVADGPLARAARASALVLPFALAEQLSDAAGATWPTPQHVTFYAVAVPFLGAVAAVVRRASDRPLPHLYRLALDGFVAVTAAVWIEHVVRGSIVEADWEVAAVGALLAVGALALLRPVRPSVPILFALAALLQAAGAGLLGAYLATSDPLGHRTDTQFVDGHLHLLLGFVLCAFLGWAHSRWSRLGDRLGVVELVLLLTGTSLFAGAETVAGEHGLPRRVADYAPQFDDENVLALVGGGLTAMALLVFLADTWSSRFPNPRLRS